MNFSFFLFFVSLSFRFVSFEKCPEALHQTFEIYFDFAKECGDCLIVSPGASFQGENWAGFCSGGQLFLFRDWMCREENNLLYQMESFALVTRELCELVEESRDLNEKCLKIFNDETCYEQSATAKFTNNMFAAEFGLKKEYNEKSTVPLPPFKKRSRWTPPTRCTHMTTPETRSTKETSTEKTTTESTSTEETSTEKTTTESTSTEDTSTEKTTTESTSTEDTSTEKTTTESTSTEETSTEKTTTESTSTEDTSTEKTTTETTITENTSERATTVQETTAETLTTIVTIPEETSIESTKSSKHPSTKNKISTTNITTPSTVDEKTTSNEITKSPSPSIEKPQSPLEKTCEENEIFFNDHCYFMVYYLDIMHDREDYKPTIQSSIISKNINPSASCQRTHPKALSLAVETKEENEFILSFLKKLYFFDKTYIFTSGVKMKGSVGEWKDWNLKLNESILNLEKNDLFFSEDGLYCIDPCNSRWWFLTDFDMAPTETKFYVLCERYYNHKNVQLELYEKCLRMYRNSSCNNLKKHKNFCCEKDEEGKLWFACSNDTSQKAYPNNITCQWKCDSNGFFMHDRPTCNGTYICKDSYKGISYIAPATRYAISGCPADYSGYSTWYCTWNRTFLGAPDYNLCCEGATPPCRDTDVFLNIWTGCPSNNIVKKTACPSGSILHKAHVEWYCHKNGTFLGDTPDYSNCNAVACKQIDRFGTEWKAAAGSIAKKKCPPRFTGQCVWVCKESGKFDGPQPDCSRCKADWMNELANKIKNRTNHEDVMEIMENYTKVEDVRIGYEHVLNLTAECVALYKEQTSECKFSVFDKFLRSYSKILKNVAGNPNIWSSFSDLNRRDYTEKILKTTQTAAFASLDSGKNGTRHKYNETFAKSETDGFDFFVAYNPSIGTRFPLENFPESDWQLDIREMNENYPSFAAMGLVMSYSLSSLMFPQADGAEGLEINAPAITFTVAASENGAIAVDPNVVVSVSFKHTNKTRFPASVVIKRRLHEGEQPSGVFNSTRCFYFRDTNWNAEGCSVTFTSKDRTNCTCNHLSTIGLLMSIHKYEPNRTLEIASTISSGITIISLILALVVFHFFDSFGNDRVLIGKNLCLCLLIGHGLLLTVLDKKFFNIPDDMCTIYAVLLHYVFMAAFAWMFVEGCHLYRMLVLVFDSDIEYRLIYMLLGYGTPLAVVGATHILGFIFKEQPYGQDELCWLKPPNYVWAFMGPVIILTSINLCILIIATKLALASKRKTEKSNFTMVMQWMKGWMSLSALLGITWLFGLAYINYNESLVYVFVFLNGLQGFFIFIFRCVLCEQYKKAFLKKIKCWFSKSKIKNRKKIENGKSETKLYVISATKSLTESKDSGYDPGCSSVEDRQKYSKKASKSPKPKTKEGTKPGEDSSSGVISDIILTPAMSEAYLRNKMIARNFSARKSKAKWLADSDNIPELSFHDIIHTS